VASQASNNGTSAVKQERDQLAVAIEAWLRTVTHAKLPNGRPLPGNAYKVAEDIARNPERGFNRTIFEHTGLLEAWPAIPTIMKATSLSKATVERMIKVLREVGCFKVDSVRGRQKSNRFQAIQNASTVRHFSEPDQQAENASVLSGKCLNPEAENASTVRHDLTDLPAEVPADQASKGKTPPSPSRRKRTPAVSQPTQPEHGVVDLQAVDLTVASPEIEWPLADNILPFRPPVPVNGAGQRRNGANHDFDRFWEIFPRDNDNDVHLAAINFHKACKLPDVTAEIVIDGAERYAAECSANPEKWKKAAHNWLFGQCWNNVPQPSRSSSHRSSSVMDDFGGPEGWMRAAFNAEKS
jgi:hypothetical protein